MKILQIIFFAVICFDVAYTFTDGYFECPCQRRSCLNNYSVAPDNGGDDCTVTIVNRSDWGARDPISISELCLPVEYVIIHHTAGLYCTSDCSSIVRGIQDYHIDENGWDDIGYNFLIGEDGKAYEGRGWDRIGAHTLGYNHIGIGIAFIGDFTTRKPNDIALDAAMDLITCGVSLGKVSTDYTLRGHRDFSNTDCPGDKLYEEIQTWPHY